MMMWQLLYEAKLISYPTAEQLLEDLRGRQAGDG